MADGEAEPTLSLRSTPSFSPRAAFIPEVAEEAGPTLSLRSTLPSAPRVVRKSKASDVDAAASPSTLPPELSTQLVEALRWLQLSSLEQKQHLNEIEKKISRLEPHQDESKRASKERTRGPVEEDSSTTVEEFTHALVGKLKFILQPYLSQGSESFASDFASKRDEWIPIPLGAYAQPRGPHGIPFATALVLGVIVSVFLLQRFDLVPQDGALHDVYSAVVNKMQGPVQRAKASSSDDGERLFAGTQKVAASIGDVINDIAGPPATRDRSAQSTTAPEDSPAGSNRNSGQAASAAPSGLQAAEDLFNSRGSGSAASSPSESVASAARTADDASSGDGATPVNVAPAVMEANLVRWRVPAYPQAARANHVKGPVVAKAIISKSGRVQDVHVIEGDPLLRNAATDALYKWRYRPYLLNGRPVEVATTITVEFKANR